MSIGFALVHVQEKTHHHYDDNEILTTEEIVRDWRPIGEWIITQEIANGRRTRRFLVTSLKVTWRKDPGGPWRRYSSTAVGPTVLASGEISPRSTGYESLWYRVAWPQEVTDMLAHFDAVVGVPGADRP